MDRAPSRASRSPAPAAFLPAAPCASRRAGAFRAPHLRVRHPSPAARRPPRAATLHMCASPPAASSPPPALSAFLTDASTLGTLRFVAVTPSAGAILETIGRLDYPLTPFATPRGARYLTLAAPDRTFEAHISLDVVRAVALASEPSKVGGHRVHVVRLLDRDDKPVLSCMLMWDPSAGPGHYLHGAVDRFQALKSKYGPRFDVLPPQ